MSNPAPQLTINLPHGDVASYEEMQAYGEILQRFIREQEAALEQVKDITRHNQIVDYLVTTSNCDCTRRQRQNASARR